MIAAFTSTPIRVALIGHGLSGAYFHAPLLEADPRFRITSVASSRPDVTRLRRDAPRRIADPFVAVAAEDADLVVIATPNDSHHALARAALLAGKHVVVDKPFVLSLSEGEDLVALAASRSRLLSVFQNRRFDGDFLAVQDLLARRELGDLVLFESRWDRFKAQMTPGWRYASGPGTGILWDLGPHLIDQALRLFGAPDRWSVDRDAQRAESFADDYFELTLWYGSLRCILSACLSIAEARPRFAVHGLRGSFTTMGLDPQEAAMRRGESPGGASFRASLTALAARLTDIHGQITPMNVAPGDWLHFYADVAAALSTGKPAQSAAEHVLPTVAILEAATGLSPP